MDLEGKYIVVEKSLESSKYGALYISEKSKEKYVRGLVIAVGNGLSSKHGENFRLPCKVGDEIIFNTHTSHTIDETIFALNSRNEKKELLLITADDVILVLKGEK